MFETILVGVDGTDGGRDALALAAVLADLWNANLIALRAYPRRDPAGRVPRLETRLRREAEIGLMQDLSESRVTRAAPFVVGGPTAAHVLGRTAQAVEAALVIVGAPREVPGQIAGGRDVVSAVLADARWPVAVAGPETRRRKLPPDAIAVGAPDADLPAPLEHAVAIARRTASPLVLLSAVDLPDDLDVDGFFVEEAVERDRHENGARARDLSDRCGIDAHGMTVVGPPGDALVDLSRAVDLLVVGSHRRPPSRPRLGRTTDRVVREASCDVLVVPATAAGASRPGPTRSETAPRRHVPPAARSGRRAVPRAAAPVRPPRAPAALPR